MGRKRQDSPGKRSRAGLRARALRALGVSSLAWLGLWASSVTSTAATPASARDTAPGHDVPVIYQKQRSFRIPFNLSASQKSRIKEVILWVSEAGDRWEGRSRTDAAHPAFSFRASHDGEYWFTVQTRTIDGKVSPDPDSIVEPKMKVIIDTVPPTLVLDPDRRRGSVAGVRWEVKDENLDLDSLTLEYQIEGAGEWTRVPVRAPRRIGEQRWDAGTAAALRARLTVADAAGNKTSAVLNLSDGTGSAPELDSSPIATAEGASPPRIEPISSPSRIVAGDGFTPVSEEPPPARPAPAPQARTRSSAAAATASRSRPRPAAPEWSADRESVENRGGAGARLASAAPASRGRLRHDLEDSNAGDPFRPARPALSPDAGPGAAWAPQTALASSGARPQAESPSAPAGGGIAGQTLLVDSPRFKLQYAVDDAGPNGPAFVELYVTPDGGRTWRKPIEDPDRTSPIDVDLGGEGTYGIRLVARSSAGFGDPIPQDGDPPLGWVVVDATPPTVQLDPVQVGMGPNAGKVAISWRATDMHLASRSVAILWRPDQPGAAWQPVVEGQEAAGRYIWNVPTNVPTRFHIRVEAADSAGHRGFAESTEFGPIVLDRSRPRSRIIGLDPNARSGQGPSAWPLR